MIMTHDASPKLTSTDRKIRILLIDDDKLLTDLISESLSYHGYEVITCNVSQCAIDLYETEFKNIDAIILDMMMPDLGGREAFAELRRVNPDAKVLLSSGYSISDDAQAMLNSGAVGFMQKPFRLAELARQVGKLKTAVMSATALK